MNGLLRDTLHELLARRILWLFGVITLILIVIILLSSGATVKMQGGGAGGDEMSMAELNEALGNPAMFLFVLFLWILSFLAIASTCGIFPNLLSAGRAEFYLSKPLSRFGLLTKKLIAVWLVYGGIVVVSASLVLSCIYAIHGNFGSGVWWLLLFEYLSIGVWLAIVTLLSILSRSTVMTFMGIFIVWVLQYILQFREGISQSIGSEILEYVLTLVYHLMPKISDIGGISVQLASGKEITSMMPIWTTAILSLVVYFASVVVFRRKDY